MSFQQDLEAREKRLLKEIPTAKGRKKLLMEKQLRITQQHLRNLNVVSAKTLKVEQEQGASLSAQTRKPSTFSSAPQNTKQQPQKLTENTKVAERLSRRLKKKDGKREQLLTKGEKILDEGKKFVADVSPKINKEYKEAKQNFLETKRNFEKNGRISTQGSDLKKHAEGLLKKTERMPIEQDIARGEEALKNVEKGLSGLEAGINAFVPSTTIADPEVQNLLGNVGHEVRLGRAEKTVGVKPNLAATTTATKKPVDKIRTNPVSEMAALERKRAALMNEAEKIDVAMKTSMEAEPASPLEPALASTPDVLPVPPKKTETVFSVPVPSIVASEASLYPNLNDLSIPPNKPIEIKKADPHNMPSWSKASTKATATAGVTQTASQKHLTEILDKFSTTNEDKQIVLKDRKTILAEYKEKHGENEDYEIALNLFMNDLQKKDDKQQISEDHAMALKLQKQYEQEDKRDAKQQMYRGQGFALNRQQQKRDELNNDDGLDNKHIGPSRP